VPSIFTMGAGQFCIKPGVVFVPQSHKAEFIQTLQNGVEGLAQHVMLPPNIASRFNRAIERRCNDAQAQLVAGKPDPAKPEAARASTTVFGISLPDFLVNPDLGEEVFGPTTLLVYYGAEKDLLAAAQQLHGHLTAALQGTEQDLANARELIRVLETKVGRILFNGYPTGVEVNHAIVHGGPFPATSDGRSTSVGTQAILRFVRPNLLPKLSRRRTPRGAATSKPAGHYASREWHAEQE
jgi:alpha-ketoglutaric semialdehyde dehydrogenase